MSVGPRPLAGKRLCVPDDARLHVLGNEDMEGFVRENEAAVASMGGEVVPWPVPREVSSIDYIVLASSDYEQYAHIKREAERLGAQMVSDFWIEEARTTNRLDVASVIHRPLPSGGVPGLANQAAVCLTAVRGRARELAKSMLVVAGMEEVKIRDERLTHLVAGKARGEKFDFANAREPRPHIVTPDWLAACLREWLRVPEHRFFVPVPMSPTGTESALTRLGERRSSVVTGEEAKPAAADEPRLAATPAAADEDIAGPYPPAMSTRTDELAVVEEEPAPMAVEPLPPVPDAAGEEKEDEASPASPSAPSIRQPTAAELQHDNDRNLSETTATQNQPPAVVQFFVRTEHNRRTTVVRLQPENTPRDALRCAGLTDQDVDASRVCWTWTAQRSSALDMDSPLSTSRTPLEMQDATLFQRYWRPRGAGRWWERRHLWRGPPRAWCLPPSLTERILEMVLKTGAPDAARDVVNAGRTCRAMLAAARTVLQNRVVWNIEVQRWEREIDDWELDDFELDGEPVGSIVTVFLEVPAPNPPQKGRAIFARTLL